MSIDFASIFAGAADEYVADSRRMEELTGKLILTLSIPTMVYKLLCHPLSLL